MSIRYAPPGSVSSSRVTVVWRPRPSDSRTSAGGLALLAEQRVDQRRLAGARRAEQDRGAARRQELSEGVHALAGDGADRQRVGDAHPARELRRLQVALLVEVGLGEDERRRHAAGGRQRGEALQPPRLRVRQRLGDEREVDVGGQHLAARDLAGRAPDDRAASRLDGGDRAALVEHDAVARDGRLGQPPAGGDQLVLRCDQPQAAVLRDDAGRQRWISRSSKRTRRRRRAPDGARCARRASSHPRVSGTRSSGSWRRCGGAASRVERYRSAGCGYPPSRCLIRPLEVMRQAAGGEVGAAERAHQLGSRRGWCPCSGSRRR